jgi:hypothetical protein
VGLARELSGPSGDCDAPWSFSTGVAYAGQTAVCAGAAPGTVTIVPGAPPRGDIAVDRERDVVYVTDGTIGVHVARLLALNPGIWRTTASSCPSPHRSPHGPTCCTTSRCSRKAS